MSGTDVVFTIIEGNIAHAVSMVTCDSRSVVRGDRVPQKVRSASAGRNCRCNWIYCCAVTIST